MNRRSNPSVTSKEGTQHFYSDTLQYRTGEGPEFNKITSDVQEVVKDSGIKEGRVFVYSKHTTAAIVIQENEPLLLEDFETFLKKLAPENAPYRHNDFEVRTVNMHEDECENGHSHCRHLTMGPSELLPVVEGEIVTGEWQEIFLVELDHPRDREVLVQVNGVKRSLPGE